MNDVEQRAAAKKFASDWQGKGYEKGQSQPFWLTLLHDVYGVAEPAKYIDFENRVKLHNTSFIDGYIDATKVLIEQKGIEIDLRASIRQSDGSLLTPFQQAKRYASELPYSKRPRWIVASNFKSFLIYDMERPNDDPQEILLKDLEKEYHRLSFLVNTNARVQKELEVSIKAGELIGKLYDAILKQYKDPSSEATLKSLNVLCVRLVFCMYAEDAGIFGERNMFLNYLREYDARKMRGALIELFKVLDTEEDKRDPYIDAELANFPYVNGGLFAGEEIKIPQFTDEIRELLLDRASADFDWSLISPTIFGALFESTLNPETRRSGGMHYTSIENIHKVIDPLFLTDLANELESIKAIGTKKTRKEALLKYQEKLASLKFLDPACGSGNFLTETYLSLRHLENEALREYYAGAIILGDLENPIKVSIQQFYGIEINDFAGTVAKTALWIAESQMMKETEDVIHMQLNFLPLKSYVNIIEGNALRLDWESIIPRAELSYIMGNPPFVGGMYMTASQKKDIREIFPNVTGAGEFDYVTGWYEKASHFILGTKIRCAFVSTNSICQGSQVITFWKYLMMRYSIHIDFAHTTFVWNNEASNQAKVHCVIVGFSGVLITNTPKYLFSNNFNYKTCTEISPYLTDTPVTFIESRSIPLCNVPKMRFGSMPRDGGGLVLTEEERASLIQSEPLAQKWIRSYIGATEFLNNKARFCLWLVDAEPSEINKCPTVKNRVQFVKETRAASKAEGTRKFAATPTLFCQIAQPDSDYIIFPKTSSGKRRYIPLGFMDKSVIASDLVFLIPDAGLYEFGILMSNVHNAWMRLVAGRLKSDYRYSKDIVYNNFPWCNPSASQRAKIERTAQCILDARASYPKSTLADLYDEALMPPRLRIAHRANDRAVMEAYGFWGKLNSESECVAELMKMYQELVKK